MRNPLINGIAFGYAEVVLNILGDDYTDVRAISYKSPITRGKTRGTSMRPRAMTSGEIDYEASIELTEEEYRALITKLGDGFALKKFDITVSYSNDDGSGQVDNPKTYTDKIQGARLKDSEKDHSQGPDGLTVKVPLDVMRILYGDGNGNFLDPVGNKV